MENTNQSFGDRQNCFGNHLYLEYFQKFFTLILLLQFFFFFTTKEMSMSVIYH